jgi:copper/silver efflux system protein
VSSTLLTLIVIPAIYAVVKGWSLRRERAATVDAPRSRRTRPALAGDTPAS